MGMNVEGPLQSPQLLLPCHVSMGTAISGGPSSDTELCYHTQDFGEVVSTQSQLK